MIEIIKLEDGTLDTLSLADNLREFFSMYEGYITVWDNHCEYLYVVKAEDTKTHLWVEPWECYDNRHSVINDPLYDLKIVLYKYLVGIGLNVTSTLTEINNVDEAFILEHIQQLKSSGVVFSYSTVLSTINPYRHRLTIFTME